MTDFSQRQFAGQTEVRGLDISSDLCSFRKTLVPTYRAGVDRSANHLSGDQRVRQAVLRSFSESFPCEADQLLHLSRREWRRLLPWLHVSGLALYFFDRFTELGLRDALPQAVINCLQQNTDENLRRTHGMVNESVAIQLEFQRADLSYAVMKGIALTPLSVSRLELRHQFDLDYLIAESDAPEGRRILELRGYHLYAISGKSWEFKINETPGVSMKDLYKDLSYRCVELHLESNMQDSRLHRLVHREMFGISMPVLSPLDSFLGQAMHSFKDIRNAFSRTSHLLEFYRHVLARCEDDIFWRELRSKAENDRRACLGIGIVTYLLSSLMGDFAPEAMKEWTVAILPPSVCLWINLYGRRVVFGNHPGTKLYLLLQKELENSGETGKFPIKNSLLPKQLPPFVIRASRDESFLAKIGRYRVQIRFLFSRLRFHLVEGIRYMVELYGWRRYLDRLPS